MKVIILSHYSVHVSECYSQSVVMMSDDMLIPVLLGMVMLSVAIKSLMLSVVLLNVVEPILTGKIKV